MGAWLRVVCLAALGVNGCALLLDTEDLAGGRAPSTADAGQQAPNVDASETPGADAGAASKGDGGSGIRDAAPDGPLPPLSCPSNALLCDDFEDGNFGRWSRTFMYPTGEQSFDTRRVHSGAMSLHAAVGDPGAATGVGVTYDLPTPLSTGTFTARAYVYSAEVPKIWTDLMRLTQGASYTSMGIATPNWRTYTWEQSFAYSDDAFKPGVWQCVEWVVELGSPGRLRVYVDETPVINEVKNTVPPDFAGWNAFSFGIVYNEGDKGADIYFDDVAIGTSQLGCR